MSEATTQQSHEHRHYSPSAQVHVVETLGRGGAAVLLAVAFLSLSFAIAAFVFAMSTREMARLAERETRLQRVETDEMKVALRMQGIQPMIHEAGDKP